MGKPRNKYAMYDLDDPRVAMSHGAAAAASAAVSTSDEDYYEDEYELDSSSSAGGHRVDEPAPPQSAVPLLGAPPPKAKRTGNRKHGIRGGAGGKGHRHTASIASLIRGEDRTEEDGWSPVADRFVLGAVPAAKVV